MRQTYLENYRSKGQSQNWLLPKKHGGIFTLFSNEFLVFVYRKSEKICSAIYLITNFIKDNEPLKTRIREASLKLLSVTLSFTDIREEEMSVCLTNVLKRTLELSALFDLSFRAGLVSEMNYSIIKRELDSLTENIGARVRKKGGAAGLISKEFFTVDSKLAHVAVLGKKGPVEEVNTMSPNMGAASDDDDHDRGQTIKKDNMVAQGHKVDNKGQSLYLKTKPSIFSDRKLERVDKIMSALKQNKEMTVKELSIFIRDFSEKTIQRDLNFLLHKGLLSKYGDKRWSKYSLKDKI